MSEHGPATISQFSSVRSEPLEQQHRRKSAEALTRQAREQASQAGEYLARNVQEYPFGALLVAGLVGYGLGYLIHSSRSSEPWAQSYPEGHSGDVLRPLE
jgi:F0F1-type ATP synthase assembly protein I